MRYLSHASCIDQIHAVLQFFRIAVLPEVRHGENSVSALHRPVKRLEIIKIAFQHVHTAFAHRQGAIGLWISG